jgi:predicted ATPase/DNA-binding winged helix-turn-helix (wHTH) protein
MPGGNIIVDPKEPRVAPSARCHFRFGSFTFRLPERMLEIDGRAVRLGSRAMELLTALLTHRGQLVSNRSLQEAVWPGITVDESALRVHLSGLRRTLTTADPSTSYIVNEPGRGYRIACPVDAQAFNDPPELGNAPGPCLPESLTSVVGRDATMAELRGVMSRHRLLSIVGPGGIGKTTIALALARSIGARVGSIRFVDFSSVAAPHLVASTIALTLGVGVTTGDPVPSVAATLAQDDDLLILDNCEHLVDSIADVVARLLRAAPRLRLLATSREPLRIAGEWVHRLAPLAVPPTGTAAPTAIQFASVQLLTERARAACGVFEVSADNADALCAICRQLDGIPLALEFAAARLDMMDPATLLERLGNRLLPLTKGWRTASPRHRTLRATIDWSYDLLDPAARTLLHRLAVFRSAFDLADVLAIAPDLDAIEGLGELCAKSLLGTDRGAGLVRYRLLDMIRHYASEKLAERGEAALVSRLHARHCLSVLSAEAADGHDPPGPAHRLDDIRSAIDWAFAQEIDLGVDLVLAAAPLWFALSLTEECAREARRAIAVVAARRDPALAREVRLLCVFGRASYHSHWPPVESAPAYDQELDLDPSVADRRLE